MSYYSDTNLYEIEEVLRRWHASKSQYEIIAAMCKISEMTPDEYAKMCCEMLNNGLTELRREKQIENDTSKPETARKQETGEGCQKRLVGRLVFAGDLEINGEEISGCALDIDRSTLIAAAELPMYRSCAIIPIDEKGLDCLIAACVPGGDLCDPQAVADNIRNYFSTND